ncbi:MAG TPA: calcium-binding EGF-like domain-containing protein [Saprospiraceae bacterium]|nr:calcium-binding EGF-like domain-containing protein [Saprospiraceae bacterium]
MRSIQFVFVFTTFLMLGNTSCSTNDSCENTICLNGGVCVNGICDCPERFTGPNCQEQLTPDKIQLLAVRVARFPAFNGDRQWDGTDGPDLFFRLYDEDGPLAQPLTLIENADPAREYQFSINTMFLFNVTQLYTLRLLDYEGVGILSEDMGEIQFHLYQDTNGFPGRIVVDDGGPLAFTLDVEYLYSDAASESGF